MKYIIVACIGAVVGAFGMSYHYDAKVRAATNAHIDSAVSQGATSAHNALAGK